MIGWTEGIHAPFIELLLVEFFTKTGKEGQFNLRSH